MARFGTVPADAAMTAEPPLPPVPPPDASLDAARRSRLEQMQRRHLVDMALAFAQFALAAVGGGWAASASAPTWDDAAVYGALGLVFSLAAAWAAMRALTWIALLAWLPRLLHFAFSRPAPSRLEPQAGDRAWGLGLLAAQVLVFVGGAMLTAAVIWAAAEQASLAATLLRFLVVAAALSLLTPRLARVVH
jgi:hypothetical protein